MASGTRSGHITLREAGGVALEVFAAVEHNPMQLIVNIPIAFQIYLPLRLPMELFSTADAFVPSDHPHSSRNRSRQSVELLHQQLSVWLAKRTLEETP